MTEFKGEKSWNKTTRIFKINIFFYGILLGFVMMLGIFLGSRSPVINHYMTVNHGKQEIFKYLEVVQPLEEAMYPVLAETVIWNQKYTQGQKLSFESLDEKMKLVDELLMMLIKVPNNPQVMASHVLLMEELKIIKYVMIEQKFAHTYDDGKSIEKAQAYLKEFQNTAKLRRATLKKMLEQYNISYIDLGDRIKYRIK